METSFAPKLLKFKELCKWDPVFSPDSQLIPLDLMYIPISLFYSRLLLLMMRKKDTLWSQEDNLKLKLKMVANTTLMPLTNRDFGFSPEPKPETNNLSTSFKISPPKKGSMFPSSMT